jgi:purine nucleosidase
MHRVIIDCDPGIDDALALLLACASPEIELLGVTAVAGNRPLETTGLNACRILDAAGRTAVPVFAGCARPMAHPAPRCNGVHGDDGLGGVQLPTRRGPREEHASDFIANTLLAADPNSVTLVAVGPLTNLALVEIKYPGLLQRAKRLLVMGGAAFCPGNVTPCAEFNFYADALAAHVVMGAGAQVRLFGLDVTGKAHMPDEWIASFGRIDSRCGRAARDMLQSYAAQDPLLHDACPVAWLLDTTLFSGEPATVTVDWRPGPTEGHTCAWPMSRNDRPRAANAVVFTEVDTPRLLTLVRERIARLP